MIAATLLLLAFLQPAASQATVPAPTPTPAPAPAPAPGCSAPAHHQFDFWIGDWDVVPNGAPAQPGRKPARNTVTKIQGGCVIHENWQAATNSGQSFNIYDRSRGQWHQTWVDSSGGLHEYWGGREGANMVFHGSMPAPSNPALRVQVRVTFFDLGNGKIRQFSESLNADGAWTVNYDLLYTRRAP